MGTAWTNHQPICETVYDNNPIGTMVTQMEMKESLSAAQFSAALGATVFMSEPVPSLVGCAVQIRGLVAKPDLNGQHGVALEWQPASQRYRVQLTGKRLFSLKAANLVATRGADAESTPPEEEIPEAQCMFTQQAMAEASTNEAEPEMARFARARLQEEAIAPRPNYEVTTRIQHVPEPDDRTSKEQEAYMLWQQALQLADSGHPHRGLPLAAEAFLTESRGCWCVGQTDVRSEERLEEAAKGAYASAAAWILLQYF